MGAAGEEGGGAVTSVLEQGADAGAGCQAPLLPLLLSSSLLLWSGREGERNPRVHTLDAACKRRRPTQLRTLNGGINYSVSISMPLLPSTSCHFLPILTEASFRIGWIQSQRQSGYREATSILFTLERHYEKFAFSQRAKFGQAGTATCRGQRGGGDRRLLWRETHTGGGVG